MQTILAAALLPHAHKHYAGSVQIKVLDSLVQFADNADNVIFIPACHDECFNNKGRNSDHSVKFLKDLLVQYYGNKLLICNNPIPYDQNSMNIVIRQIRKIVGKLLIIGTVDLSHHAFNNVQYPRVHKTRAEEETITGLLERNPTLLNPNYIDAPYSVAIIHYFAPSNGVVVAYDDSATVSQKVNSHDSTMQKMDSFVSYVGIVFSTQHIANADKLRDELMLASVRNTIFHSFHNTGLQKMTHAPLWLRSSFSGTERGGGVWAGMECNGNTKCSIGRLNVITGTHQEALRDSAQSCVGDARNRWGGLSSLDHCIFKYERLSGSKPVAWNKRHQVFDPDTTGMVLSLTNGSTATYLPGVWREHWGDKDIDVVLSSLAEKAGGSYSDIDKNSLKYYKTTKFFTTTAN